jgi:hypothetical protein
VSKLNLKSKDKKIASKTRQFAKIRVYILSSELTKYYEVRFLYLPNFYLSLVSKLNLKSKDKKIASKTRQFAKIRVYILSSELTKYYEVRFLDLLKFKLRIRLKNIRTVFNIPLWR